MAFKPSPYQQRLFNHVADPTAGSAIVVAVAGAGKTTSVLQCLLRIPERDSVKCFAFNAAIVGELRDKVKRLGAEHGRDFRQVRVVTFHAEGFAAITRKLGKKIEPDSKKVLKLARQLLGERDLDLYGEFCVKLVSYAKGEGAGAITPFDLNRWHDLISHHDLMLEDEEATLERAIEIARQLLRASNEAAKDGVIDYDDMLYVPLLWRLRLWQNDWVFIDEAQDTNPVRRALAKLALRPGGRLVAVGDPKQAIYGFTGASHDAMDLIKREFNCTELPLTVSYRCAQAVVRYAQPLVPYLEAHEDAPEGEVLHLPLNGYQPHNQERLPGALDHLTANDAILCRNTAPLVKLAYALIAGGTPCTIVGRDIADGLVSLIKKMRARDVARLVEKLEHFKNREVAAFTAKGEEQKAEAVQDRVACIMTVIENLPETQRTIAGLINRLETMFSDGGDGVLQLCTAHKAKGREWPTVAILMPSLMPSKWARQEWQYEQEKNLMYVAYTRAMLRLIFIAE